MVRGGWVIMGSLFYQEKCSGCNELIHKWEAVIYIDAEKNNNWYHPKCFVKKSIKEGSR